MASNQSAFEALVQAIVGDDAATASQLLAASPVLVNVRAEQGRYLGPIEHYLYGPPPTGILRLRPPRSCL